MTRRSDLMLEDLTGCTHEPETPVCDDDGQEILYWRCRCGRRHEQKVQTDKSAFESALYKDKPTPIEQLRAANRSCTCACCACCCKVHRPTVSLVRHQIRVWWFDGRYPENKS